MYSYSTLPLLQIIICFIAIVLHLVAISSSCWSNFSSKNEYGISLEEGHYGLWTVCMYSTPHHLHYQRYENYEREYCNSIDTMYRLPPFIGIAGILSIVSAIVLFLYVPFAIIRHRQFSSQAQKGTTITKLSGAIKLVIATFAAILIVLVLVFFSLREHEFGTRAFIPIINFRGFWITKNWAFFVEIFVVLLCLILALLGLMENNRAAEIDASRYSSSFNVDNLPSDTIGHPNENNGQPTTYSESINPDLQQYKAPSSRFYSKKSSYQPGILKPATSLCECCQMQTCLNSGKNNRNFLENSMDTQSNYPLLLPRTSSRLQKQPPSNNTFYLPNKLSSKIKSNPDNLHKLPNDHLNTNVKQLEDSLLNYASEPAKANIQTQNYDPDKIFKPSSVSNLHFPDYSINRNQQFSYLNPLPKKYITRIVSSSTLTTNTTTINKNSNPTLQTTKDFEPISLEKEFNSNEEEDANRNFRMPKNSSTIRFHNISKIDDD